MYSLVISFSHSSNLAVVVEFNYLCGGVLKSIDPSNYVFVMKDGESRFSLQNSFQLTFPFTNILHSILSLQKLLQVHI
jgi:hypothetical protein